MSLEARLQKIEDYIEIEQLIAKYGPTVDSGQGSLLGEMWNSHGSYLIGDEYSLNGEEVQTLTEFETHQDYITKGCGHILTTPLISIINKTAEVINYSIVLVHQNEKWVADRVSANKWILEKNSEGWKVLTRQNRLLNGDEKARALLGSFK